MRRKDRAIPDQPLPRDSADNSRLELSEVTVQEILTRTSGYLTDISSHSLQPYCGCTFGRSLCGVGCYVQHNFFVTRGRPWGKFLEVRINAAEAYRKSYAREQKWARKKWGRFSIFCSSSTDPFLPQEQKYGVTARLLRQMLLQPPDELILQTHSPQVTRELETLRELTCRTALRVHVSIESDRDRLPGLPPAAATVAQRMTACRQLKQAGIRTLVTVAPLLPIQDPTTFFRQLGEVSDGVILDHFIGGDGSSNGSRTQKTPLIAAMQALDPESTTLAYRDHMEKHARTYLPGRVGIGQLGFAGVLE